MQALFWMTKNSAKAILKKLKFPAILSIILALLFLVMEFVPATGTELHAERRVVQLLQSQDEYLLGLHVDILEDPGGQLNINHLITSKTSGVFFASASQSPSFGFTASAYWLRFTLQNDHPVLVNYLLEMAYPLLDYVHFYTPDTTGGFTEMRAGDQLPFGERQIQSTKVVFPVNVPSGESRTFYLRCQTSGAMNLSLNLFTPDAFNRNAIKRQGMLGLYYGVILVMILYNLFIFLTVRDRSFLYYVLFITSFMFMVLCLNGLSYQYLWPDQPWWANQNLPFFGFMAFFFATQFTRAILNSRQLVPWLDKGLFFLLPLALVGMPVSLVVDYEVGIRLATFLSFTFVLHVCCGFICTFKGYRPARYYSLAWSVFLFFVVVYSLKSFAILPDVFWSNWGVQFGSVWEILFLSLALADRINLIEKEKQETQLTYAHKLEETNWLLEQRMNERTMELKHSNRELRQEANERKEAEKRALAASRTKSEFLANMSHEIRTPMHGVLGMTELLRQTPLTLKQAGYISTIDNSADSLLAIINDILDFSKIEAGRIELEQVDFSLTREISQIESVHGNAALQKGLEFRVDIFPEVPDMLNGDPLRLHQILTNLVGNAVKFTVHGRVELLIAVVNQDEDGFRLSFEVSDTGVGIAPERVGDIFLPFDQEDGSTTRKFGGTGLGPTISRFLVKKMGGTLEVVSDVGQGSSFRFTALFGIAKNNILDFSADEQPEARELPLFGGKILLVEDNRTNQQVGKGMLELLGCRVDLAAHGSEALDLLAEESYDLVFMDCQMPIMDGYEATRQIRTLESDAEAEHLPVIALTAHAMHTHQQECMAAGMDGHLSKPFNLEQLAEAMVAWLPVVGTMVMSVEDEKPETTPAAIASTASSVIDQKALNALRKLEQQGAKGVVRQSMEFYLEDAPPLINSIHQGFVNKESEMLRQAAHTLKSSSANIGGV